MCSSKYACEHIGHVDVCWFTMRACTRAHMHTSETFQKDARQTSAYLHYPHISASACAPPRPLPSLWRAPRQEALDSVQRRGSDPCVEHHVICLRSVVWAYHGYGQASAERPQTATAQSPILALTARGSRHVGRAPCTHTHLGLVVAMGRGLNADHRQHRTHLQQGKHSRKR
jgi:hypothetical protein